MLKVTYAIGDTWIDVAASGVWSPRDLERCYRELSVAINLMQSVGSPVRIIADLTQADIQSQNITDIVVQLTESLFSDKIRIAIVVSSVLMKLQIKRIVRGAQSAIFFGTADARLWFEE